ncbi:MAG: indole-3-glycerol phosphate synthase TrpC [Gemmatimonadota bacterium]
MSGILDRIVASKRQEVEALRARPAELRAAAAAAGPPRDFASALRAGGQVRLIAEVKRRSPSAGWLARELDPAATARRYFAAGAACVSVLTDAAYFGGGLADLIDVRAAVPLPVLRKDFIIEPLQLHEARAAGADAVLLIVRILEDHALAELHALARTLGMAALVEVHDGPELERALGAGAELVGVNNRDLDTFTTDLGLSIRLAEAVPPGTLLVAESGIRDAADVARLGAAGVDAVLVGESLVRAADGGAAAGALTGHPRAPRPVTS